MARSTARKRALNTLYEADVKGGGILPLLEERIAHPGAQTPLPDYAIEIVRGVAEHLADINETLNQHSTSWPVRRMALIDRNILRIAVWEMVYNPEIPAKVAIDEALALAKTLSEADSPSFIHGLLSAVERDQEEAAAQEQLQEERAQAAERIAQLAQSEAEAAESAPEDSQVDQASPSAESSQPDTASEVSGSQKKAEGEGTGDLSDAPAAEDTQSVDEMTFDLPRELASGADSAQ